MAIFYTDSGSFGDITVSGSAIVSGTLSFAENSGGLTGSLFGTSSWANNAQSASFIEFISIANKPELVSSSGQISITQTTGYSAFSSSIATKNDTQDISINSLNAATSSYAINSTIQGQLAGVVSSSTQVKTLLPQDTVSSSAFTSPSQGTVRATINNVQTDVDTGLQTGDSPSFTGLTLSGLTNTTATNKILVLNTSTNQIFTTESIGGGSSTSAFPFSGSAVITGSLLVSGSGIRTTGSIDLLSGSISVIPSSTTTTAATFNPQATSNAGSQAVDGVVIDNSSLYVRGRIVVQERYYSPAALITTPGKITLLTNTGGTGTAQILFTNNLGTNIGQISTRLGPPSSLSDFFGIRTLNATPLYFGTNNSESMWRLGTDATFFPTVDNLYNLGSSTNRIASTVSTLVSASIVSASTAVTASSVRVPGRIDVVSPANPASSMSISVGDVAGYASFKTSGDIIYYEFPSTQVVFNAGFIATADVSVRGAIKDDNNPALKITGGVSNITNLESSLRVSSSVANPVTVTGSINDFYELEVINANAGNNASADIVASNDQTTDFGNYIDMGMNSSTYAGALVGGPSDGYLYFTSSVGELHIGNASLNGPSNVRLFAGGPSSDAKTRIFISGAGHVGIGKTSPNAFFDVFGNQILSGSLLISASQALTASNVQLNSLTDTTSANKVLVLDTTTNKIFTTASVGTGGGPGGAAFPYNGETVPAVISGSLVVSGSRGIYLSGSALTGSVFSGSFFNIIEMSMAVSGTITASATTTVTLDMNKSNYYVVSGSGAGTVTWVVTNPPPVGRAQTFLLDYTNGGGKTNSWFTNTRWPGGVAPTLTSGSTAPDILAFTTDDAGSNWRGVLLQRASQ